MYSKNYIIDGDADGVIESNFFSQLKNMLSQSENTKDKNNDTNDTNNVENEHEDEDGCCLLTKEPLKNIHIILTCGHKFNYVPLYREVIAQKTIGMSSNGYYTSHSLKRNEIKCPYCRNIQGKLLPYLEYDGVKKLYNVNYPTKMSMTSQPCTYSANSSTNITSKKNKKTAVCKESAIECHNGIYVCKKHYQLSLDTLTVPVHANNTSATSPSSIPAASPISICGVILRYGKNKGKPCSNSSSCRVHNKIQTIT